MTATCLVFVLAAIVGAPGESTAIPAELLGTWDVEHVAVDRQDLPIRRSYKPDAPQLVGRTLLISNDEVKLERGKEFSCRPAVAQPHRTTWGFLIGKGFARPPGGGRSATPSPADFGLKVSKRASVTAYSLCSSHSRATTRFPMNNWVAPIGDRLAFNLDNQTLLLLYRRPTDARPKASFECGKATTPTEKAICGSFELASWDRSVAAAWRSALKERPDERPELEKSQRAWLRTRDACGAKTDCIYSQQWDRVEALSLP